MSQRRSAGTAPSFLGPWVRRAYALACLMCLGAPRLGLAQSSDPLGGTLTDLPPGVPAAPSTGLRAYERFNTHSGEPELSSRDISIPGNGGLPIELYRSYSFTAGEQRDPGFQLKRSIREAGYNLPGELACAGRPCASGAYSSIALITGNLYLMQYNEYNASSGLSRPGGLWRFAVAPEIEVRAHSAYFNAPPRWDAGTQLPINLAESNDVDFMYGGICGTVTTYGGRAIEFVVTLRHPDGARETLARRRSGADAVLRSQGNWELRCDSAGNPRLKLFSPRGVRYDLGLEVRANPNVEPARWLVTRATDLRTLEAVTISYDHTHPRFVHPTRIEGSDGRWLDLVYDTAFNASGVVRAYPAHLSFGVARNPVQLVVEPVLVEVRTPLGSWRYEYAEPSSDSPILYPIQSRAFLPPARRALLSVVGPPAPNSPEPVVTWRFTYHAAWNADDPVLRTAVAAGDQRLATVTEPAGGRVSYTLENGPDTSPARVQWEMSWPPTQAQFCGPFALRSGTFDRYCIEHWTELNVRYRASDSAAKATQQLRLKTRTTSDGATWQYSYQPGAAGALDRTTVRSVSTGVTDTYLHYGEAFFGAALAPTGGAPPPTTNDTWLLGQLREHQRSGDDGEVMTTTLGWQPRTYAPGPRYYRGAGWRVDDAWYAPMLASRRVSIEGGSSVSATYSDPTEYGSPQRIELEGPDPSAADGLIRRERLLTYYTDTDRWLIDFPKDEITR